MTIKYAKQLPENKRVQILGAVQLICDRYNNGEALTSISMPPRFGKSSVIRLSAMELHASTRMPLVMMAPWSDNVDQIMEAKSIEVMYRNYGIEFHEFTAHRLRVLRTHEWWKLSVGIPTLLTATLSLLYDKNNQQQFLDGVSDMYQRYKTRVPVVIDECHLVKDLQAWGKFVLKLVEHGAYLILLTGTPVPGIPGFANKFGSWVDVIRKIPRRQIIDGEIKHFLETYRGQSREISEIKADYSVSWSEAWDLGALAKANAIYVDLDVVDEDTNEPLGPLSKLHPADLRGRLKSIMESPELMTKQVDAGLNRLLQLRSKHLTKEAQLLVVTGADDLIDDCVREKGVNAHANGFKKLLREHPLSDGLRIEIATGQIEEAASLIQQFREGRIEVLIVKNMGIVGLDCPPCKVMIFGSRLRDGPMAIQALSRTLTKWGSCPASIIMPQDQRMVDLYNRMVKDQGGEYKESNLRLIETAEIDAPDEQPIWAFQGARVNAYGDERGGLTSGDYELTLLVIKEKFDTNGLNDRQIIENHQRGAFPVTDVDKSNYKNEKARPGKMGIKNLDVDYVSGDFGKEAKRITNRYCSYFEETEVWLKKNKELVQTAKRLCGTTRSTKDIDDPVLLKRLFDALSEAEQITFGRGNEHSKTS